MLTEKIWSDNMDSKHLWVSKATYSQFVQPDGKNLHWTNDINFELPIIMDQAGPGSVLPTTFINFFQETLQTHSKRVALRVKRGEK